MASSLTQTRAQSVSETTLLGACRDGEQSAAGGSEAGSRIQLAIFRHLPGETRMPGIKRESEGQAFFPPKVARGERSKMPRKVEVEWRTGREEVQQGSGIDRISQVVQRSKFGQEGIRGLDGARGFQSTRRYRRDQAPSDFQRSKEINGQIVEAGKRRDAERLWEILRGEGRSFNAVNISTWIYQCAKQTNARALFQNEAFSIAKTIFLEKLSQFDPQNLSNTVWAYAKTGVIDRDVFGKIAEEIRARRDLRDFKSQELSNTAWAYATTGRFDEDVFGKIAEEMRARRGLRDFKSQELSNTAWAFATAGIFDGGVFGRIAEEMRARRDLRDFNSQNLSNTAWAFATAGMFDRGVFGRIAEKIRATRDLGNFTPQGLSNTAWAYATAGMFDRSMFEWIAEEIRARRDLRDFKSQDLGNTAWAFVTAGIFDRGMFERIAEEVRERGLRDFNSQDLSNTAWAFAMYCVHLADRSTEACSKEIVQNLLARVSHGSLSLENRSQLGLAAAFFKIETDFLDVQGSRGSRGSRASDLERDVQRYLSQEFIPQKDLGRECSHHVADFYRETDRMVIEVDGPSHCYPRSDSRYGEPLPQTVLRNAILERHGFKVKSICYRDWDRLHSKEDKRAYIETLLRQE